MASHQREAYTRLQQQQRLQQQSKQQQQQQLAQQPQQFNGQQQQPPFSLSTLDPSLITLQYVKEEYPTGATVGGLLDPSDPFGLPGGTDYDMLGVNSIADPVDFDGHLDDSVGSVGSMSVHSQFASSQGIPLPTASSSTSANHHFYSMSMPVRTTNSGLGSSSHHKSSLHNSQQQQQQQQALAGSQASSYQSYASNSTGGGGVPPLSSLRGEHDSLKHLEILNEKRRRRRESHNAVERRRRDHINEKIAELSQLLPEFAGDAQNKPNKGTILKRSVDYLRHIQTFAAKQIERNKELEQVLAALCDQQGIPLDALGLSVPLGTPIEIPPMNESSTPTEHMDDQDE